jgi:hypothetical protein
MVEVDAGGDQHDEDRSHVRAAGLDELGRLIVSRIQVLDGVTRTLTCMVLHR